MNEHECWGLLGYKLNTFGVATRLENSAASSVPDVLFMTGGLMMFIEMKVDYAGKIYVPPFQFSYGVRIANQIKDHMHWVAVWVDKYEGFAMFTFKRLRSMPCESKNGKLVFDWADVWNSMKTQFVIKDLESCELFIDTILRLEFK